MMLKAAGMLFIAILLTVGLGACTIQPRHRPTIPMPLISDANELHWRMHFEDQFDCYGQAAPPPPNAPDVAWVAYYAARDSYRIKQAAQAAGDDTSWEDVRKQWEEFGRTTRGIGQGMTDTADDLGNTPMFRR